MLARQRQAMILDRVRETGAVRVADLARDLGVSDMTVRRDLEILHEHGLLEKVHGGATLDLGLRVLRARVRRQVRAPAGREGRRSRRPPRRSSSPAWRSRSPPARRPTRWPARVAEIPGVTVVTNSLRGRRRPPPRPGGGDQTVILTGGVRTPSEALVGSFAVAQLRSIHLDLVFMGVHGMDAKAGFTCPNLLEAETDRALIEAGRRLVVIADHSKWGVVGIASIARLDQADVLVSDRNLDPAAQQLLGETRARAHPRRTRATVAARSPTSPRSPTPIRRVAAAGTGSRAH